MRNATLDTTVQTRLVTDLDRSRLRGMIDAMLPYAYTNRVQLLALQGELADAYTVPPGAVPADVVTLNSTVRIRDIGTEKDETFTIVFPGLADPAIGRTSVLSPVGMAVLGRREGDIVGGPPCPWVRPSRIEEVVSQPEREGRFDL